MSDSPPPGNASPKDPVDDGSGSTVAGGASEGKTRPRWRHLGGPGKSLVLGCTLLLGIALIQIYDNQRAFTITGATHGEARGEGWMQPGAGDGFEPINLPYFLDDGLFRIRFESTAKVLNLDLYADDCVVSAAVDGRIVYRQKDFCRRCHSFVRRRGGKTCKSTPISIPLSDGGSHLLAVQTQTMDWEENTSFRDTGIFLVEHAHNAFFWRGLAVLAALGLLGLALGLLRLRNGFAPRLRAFGRSVWERRAFLVIVLAATGARVIVAPSFQTTDVYQSAVIYTEDMVNKVGWEYAALDPQYTAAKYEGGSHMHKPPGLYYQFGLVRALFGFGKIYYHYLTSLPAIVGDLLIGFVIWSVVRRRYDEWRAQLGALFYLLAGGIFMTTGVVGRVDSMAIALLLLALANVHRRRFCLYLGAAVASKQLAILAVPWLIFRRQTFGKTIVAGCVTLVLVSPFLIDDPALFFERLLSPQLNKPITGLSVMQHLRSFDKESALFFSQVFTLILFGALLVLPLLLRVDVWMGAAISFALFVVFSKNLHEHYILWSTGPLLIVYFLHGRVLALGAAMFGALGMVLTNESGTVLAHISKGDWILLLAAMQLLACLDLIIQGWSPRTIRERLPFFWGPVEAGEQNSTDGPKT